MKLDLKKFVLETKNWSRDGIKVWCSSTELGILQGCYGDPTSSTLAATYAAPGYYVD